MNTALETVTFDEAVHQAEARLAAAQVPHARADARRLLAHAARVTGARLIAIGAETVDPPALGRFYRAIDRRAAGEPVSRITGARQFYDLEFALAPHVLDPRPETELIVDAVIADFPGDRQSPARIADIGTGSGVLAICLARAFAQAELIACDIDRQALATAAANAARLGVANRIEFIRSDWADGLRGVFDVIVSNPPYIASGDIAGLDKEVRDYDPSVALDGGRDGLDGHRALLETCGSLMSQRGRIYLEMGFDQAQAVQKLALHAGWRPIRIIRDLAGLDRVLVAEPVGSRRGVRENW